MKPVGAHVRNGQIPDDHVAMSREDLADLEAALDDSAAQFDRGEFEDARALAVRIATRAARA